MWLCVYKGLLEKKGRRPGSARTLFLSSNHWVALFPIQIWGCCATSKNTRRDSSRPACNILDANHFKQRLPDKQKKKIMQIREQTSNKTKNKRKEKKRKDESNKERKRETTAESQTQATQSKQSHRSTNQKEQTNKQINARTDCSHTHTNEQASEQLRKQPCSLRRWAPKKD